MLSSELLDITSSWKLIIYLIFCNIIGPRERFFLAPLLSIMNMTDDLNIIDQSYN